MLTHTASVDKTLLLLVVDATANKILVKLQINAFASNHSNSKMGNAVARGMSRIWSAITVVHGVTLAQGLAYNVINTHHYFTE